MMSSVTVADEVKVLLALEDLKAVPRLARAGQLLPCRILNVVDGDTVNVVIVESGVPSRTSIRILGVDTPEKARSTRYEIAAGLRVKQLIVKMLEEKDDGRPVIRWVVREKHDKYGGRQNGDIFFTRDGPPLSQFLLDNELALPYEGRKKVTWTREMCVNVHNRAKRILDALKTEADVDADADSDEDDHSNYFDA